MAVNYKIEKYAFFTEGDSLTEQEHKDSCDINKMVKNAMRGLDIHTRPIGKWEDGAVDDLTQDLTSHLIRKQEVEESLLEISQTHEFTDEELALIDKVNPKLKDKFKLRKKAKTNDDKTTNETASKNNTSTPPHNQNSATSDKPNSNP